MKDYMVVQDGLIDLFKVAGLHFARNYRLDLFWLWRNLDKFDFSPKERKQASDSIETLVNLRKQGLEPPHREGRYG